MTPERSKLRTLFQAALDLESGARKAFLLENCGDDSDLYRELEDLLRYDLLAGKERFLETETGSNPSLLSGSKIASYRLKEVLGQGGTGIVYRAVREDDFSQEVAIKVLSFAISKTQAKERFLKEREILAGLNHPNIGRILDGGKTENNHLYYVMTLIHGNHIDEFCEFHHLDYKERLKLLVSVCETLAYAHKNEVIHRDLKPSNLLVTQERSIYVVDFGLARLPGLAELTITGEVLGTPLYMAPELAAGNGNSATPATDIYSLGCVLYKLLTKEAPFQGEHPWRTLLKVVQSDPVAPSKLNPGVPADLDSICLKCLSKEPLQRYRSATELADDLQRFIAGKPVLAKQPTWFDYALNWSHRHRWLIILLSICLVTGIVVGLVYNNAKTSHALELAKRAADNLLDSAMKINHKPGIQRSQVDMLSNAINTYASLLLPLGDEQTYLRYYQAMRELTHCKSLLGNEVDVEVTRSAERMLMEIEERLKARWSPNLAVELANWCWLVAAQYDSSEGRSRAISLTKRSISLLEDALKAKPESDGILGMLAEKHGGLGSILMQCGEPLDLDADKEWLVAKELFKPLYLKYPRDPLARIRYCGFNIGIWDFYLHTHRAKDRGFTALHEAVKIDRMWAHDFPDRPDFREQTINSVKRLAVELESRGEWEQANSLLDDIITHYSTLMKLYPDVPKYQLQLAYHLLIKGELTFALNQQETSKRCFRQSIQQLEELIQKQPKDLNYHLYLCDCLADCPILDFRNTTKAVELGRLTTELTPKSLWSWIYYGKSQLRVGQLENAERSLKQAMTLCIYEDDIDLLRMCLALTYAKGGRNDLAKSEMSSAERYFTRRPKGVVMLRLKKEVQQLLDGIPAGK